MVREIIDDSLNRYEVVPPMGNTIIGYSALTNITTGCNNVAIGLKALTRASSAWRKNVNRTNK